MKINFIVTAVGVAVLSGSAIAQNAKMPPTANTAPFLGVWHAQMDSMPAIDLVLTDEGGDISGAVLFYFHFRKSVNDPYTSTPRLPEPLLNLRLDGSTLHFKVSHRRAHPPRTFHDPPVSFRLTLLGPDKAGLVNESQPAQGNGLGLPMTRSAD